MLRLKVVLFVTVAFAGSLAAGSIAGAHSRTSDIGPLIDPNGRSLAAPAMPGESDIGPLIDPNGRS